MTVVLDRVTVVYPDATPLNEMSLTIGPGSTAIMGPSGSGKSTLLRLIAGTQSPLRGTVSIDGTEVQKSSWLSAGDPRVALIHQDYRLVPFLTVEQNLELAAEMRELKLSRGDLALAMDKVSLPGSMARRLPNTLSGGEQQRVAIARALVVGVTVVLADEPTGALDEENTERITDVFAQLGRTGLTVVVATHDPGVGRHLDRCLRLTSGAMTDA